MLDHVQNRIIAPYPAEFLNRIFNFKPRLAELSQRAARSLNLFFEERRQYVPVERSRLAEFLVAITNIESAAEPRRDPLSYVPGKMKDQIPSAVRSRVRPPPDIIFPQPLQAGGNARVVFLAQGLSSVPG